MTIIINIFLQLQLTCSAWRKLQRLSKVIPDDEARPNGLSSILPVRKPNVPWCTSLQKTKKNPVSLKNPQQ